MSSLIFIIMVRRVSAYNMTTTMGHDYYDSTTHTRAGGKIIKWLRAKNMEALYNIVL